MGRRSATRSALVFLSRLRWVGPIFRSRRKATEYGAGIREFRAATFKRETINPSGLGFIHCQFVDCVFMGDGDEAVFFLCGFDGCEHELSRARSVGCSFTNCRAIAPVPDIEVVVAPGLVPD